MAGRLEGPLINEHMHRLSQGLVSAPDAGNPDLGNYSGAGGRGSFSLHSLWAWKYCLPVPSPPSPHQACIPGPIPALPFLGLLRAEQPS